MAISAIRPDGRFACATEDGQLHFLTLRNVELGTPFVTIGRVFRYPRLRRDPGASFSPPIEGPIPGAGYDENPLDDPALAETYRLSSIPITKATLAVLDGFDIEGQDWSGDPYTLTERDGRLYGRGSADMKGFLATVLAAVPAMQEAPLKVPVQLAFSYDEEVGCLGAPELIAAMRAAVPDGRSTGPRSPSPVIGRRTQPERFASSSIRRLATSGSSAPHAATTVMRAAATAHRRRRAVLTSPRARSTTR